MEWETVFKFVTASIASIGLGGALVFSLSSWLGKVWAARILEKEKLSLNEALEKTKTDLEVIKETTLRFQNDKILTYRAIIDVVASILASFDAHQLGHLTNEQRTQKFHEFNEQRLRVYGYLAMLAPQAVMDAQDNLMDYLIKISHGSDTYEWEKVRSLAIAMLNKIRNDIGINESDISYNGEL
jgi:hypothetical protein